MAKINTSDATTLANETSFIALYNANNALVETGSDNFLSLDGTSPNSMSASLDMNSNRIINLPTPSNGTEPLRLQDYNTLVSGGTITVVAGREKLTTSRTYYVRTDGSDSNTGLIDSAGGAFRTIQFAVDTITLLDANLKSIIIQVRSGTYNEDVFLKPILGGPPNGSIILRGDTTTPSNVIINGTSNCIFALGSITNDWLVEGFKFTSGIYGIHGHANAWIRVGKVEFGACGTAHIIADYLGTVELQGAYTISGNSTYHAYAFCGGFILNAIVQATLTGTPAFSGSFAAAINRSYIEWNGGTFSGSATGTRYLVNANSVINTAGGGANFFPGNGAGSAGTGGLYA